MITELPPGLILIFGGLLVPLLPSRLRPFLMIILPFVAFAHLLALPDGEFGQVQIMGLPLVTLRVDKLSLMFGYVFLLAAFLGGLYALHVRDSFQQSAGLIYAGSAIGAVFAGDLVTLFIFWEGVAIASVFLIWAARNERAYRAGMRYLIVQLTSGMLLLIGALLHASDDFVVGGGAGEIDDIERNAESVQMAVCVGQAGKDGAVEHGNDIGARVFALELGCRSDLADRAATRVDRVVFLRGLCGAGHDRAADEEHF